jgi:hypothetical protein
MTVSVIHHPRVAWDGARAFVAACENLNVFPWFKAQVWQLLGPDYYELAQRSFVNLMYAEDERAHQIESGMWRVRLAELLETRPDMVGPLLTFIGEIREHT